MKTLAIASGKGGTGKTTLAVSLSMALVKEFGKTVSLSDCDVEEPNCHLFFDGSWDSQRASSAPFVEFVPPEDKDCGSCQQCMIKCRFNAIAVVKSRPVFFPELCHGCGACELACPNSLIKPSTRRMGEIRFADKGDIKLTDGLLDIGVAMATSLIDEVKKMSSQQTADINVLDSPPGTSCAMIEAVSSSDFTIFVTEPTPFGLHDLKRAVAVAKNLSLDFAVVVNRDDGQDNRVHEYCRDENIAMLASISHSRDVAESYCCGKMPYGNAASFTQSVNSIAAEVVSRCGI